MLRVPHAVRHLLEVLGFALGGLLLLLGVLAWRLSEGPIEVRFLTPYLEQALSRGGMRVEIGRTVIAWQGLRRPLRLAATDIRIADAEQHGQVAIPEMVLSLSGRALLGGRIVLSRVELIRPALHFVRLASGEVRMGLGSDLAALGQTLEPGPGFGGVLLEALASRPEAADDPLAGLTQLVISAGELHVDDRLSGQSWSAPAADISLARSASGVVGQIAFAVELAGRRASLDADLSYERTTGRSQMALRIGGLVPAALVPIDPLLAPLAALETPVAGTFTATFDRAFTVEDGRFDLAGGPGQIVLPEVYPAPLTMAGVTLSGGIDGEAETMSIGDLTVDFGGPRLGLRADLANVDGTLDMVGEVVLTDVPVDLLPTYWPPAMGVEARAWVVESLSHGIARTTAAAFHMRAPFDDLAAATLVGLDGEIAFDGVDGIILDPLPPVTGVAGHATFDTDTFRVTTTGGRIGGLTVPQSQIAVLLQGGEPDPMSVEVVVSGGLRDALAILAMEPIGYRPRLFEEGNLSGTMSARLRFEVPLRSHTDFAEIEVAAAANLADVTLVLTGHALPVDIVAAQLSLDGRGMAVTGTGALGGEPLRFDWSERFGAGEPYGTRIAVDGTLDEAARRDLGIPTLDGVGGRVGFNAVYTDIDRHNQTLTADLDLVRASLDLSPLGWSKPAGAAGLASLAVDLVDGTPLRLSRYSITAPGLAASGAVQFSPGGRDWQEIGIDQLTLGESSLRGSVARAADGSLSITARGTVLDAGAWLAEGPESGPDPEAAPRQIDFAFDRVLLGEYGTLQAASGRLRSTAGRWTMADVRAETVERTALSFRWDASGGAGSLDLRAADAGATLRSLDLADNVDGGQLVITGTRTSADAPIQGQVWLDNYRVRNIPFLARLLAAVSFSGLQDLMTGSGLSFAHLRAGYAYDGEGLTIRDARTSGGSLGLTMDAAIDLDAEIIDADGTVVPIYAVNNALGRIPLLGTLLTGGPGEGVFAFTYGASGPLSAPTVWVNPLAALAPGFLRNLFFLGEPATVGALDAARR